MTTDSGNLLFTMLITSTFVSVFCACCPAAARDVAATTTTIRSRFILVIRVPQLQSALLQAVGPGIQQVAFGTGHRKFQPVVGVDKLPVVVTFRRRNPQHQDATLHS